MTTITFFVQLKTPLPGTNCQSKTTNKQQQYVQILVRVCDSHAQFKPDQIKNKLQRNTVSNYDCLIMPWPRNKVKVKVSKIL